MRAPWRTLRGRLILASLAGLLAASLVFAVVSSSLVRSVSERNAREQFDQETMRVARLASAQLEKGAQEGRDCRSYTSAEFEAFVGPGARIYLESLNVCPGTGRSIFPKPSPQLRAAVDQGLVDAQGFARISPSAIPGGRDYVATAAPLRLRGQSFGSLIIVKPRDEVRSAVADVAPRLALAALVGLVPAVFLTLLMTTRLTRPIREMREATDRVAGGDLGTEVQRAGTADLDALADDFNIMVSRLRQRDAQSRDFLMKITHDLRTPLTAIRGHASALLDGVVPDDLRSRSLEAIEGEAHRLETMVRDLLDLSRMEAEQFRLTVAECDPGPVVDHAISAHAVRAAEKGVKLKGHVHIREGIITDPDRLGQIVGNLVDNAVRWTPTGGTVTVTASSVAERGLQVEVTDSGPGVPPDQRELVFSPFQSSETPDGSTGTGLGLAICRQLARALGGDVTVDGGPEGGARFVLRLPPNAPVGARRGGVTAPDGR